MSDSTMTIDDSDHKEPIFTGHEGEVPIRFWPKVEWPKKDSPQAAEGGGES